MSSTSSCDEPTWSPDGTRLSFRNTASPGIWTIAPDGTGAMGVGTKNVAEPNWQ